MACEDCDEEVWGPKTAVLLDERPAPLGDPAAIVAYHVNIPNQRATAAGRLPHTGDAANLEGMGRPVMADEEVLAAEKKCPKCGSDLLAWVATVGKEEERFECRRCQTVFRCPAEWS